MRITASLVVFWGTSAALADEVVPSDEAAARVVFTSPADGDILKSPVLVQFALTGMDLASRMEAVIERRFVRSRVCDRAGHRRP